jgi:hypothetical protein
MVGQNADMLLLQQQINYLVALADVKVLSFTNHFIFDPLTTDMHGIPGPLCEANFLFIKIKFQQVFLHLHRLILVPRVLELALKS